LRAHLEAPLAHVHFGGLHAKEISVMALAVAGGALYPLLLFAFGGVTPGEVKAAFRRGKGQAAAPAADLP
jgi:putative peptidoglycan lipid II flippase